jgi:hypothetical protein
MTGPHVIARHGVHPPDRRRIWRILGAIALLPLALPASCALYLNLVPAHSASFHVGEIDTTVSLAFHWVWAESGGNSGRYLTVRSRQGSVTHHMCGFDWAHFPRTRVYLTAERTIAVQGSDECLPFVRPDLIVSYNARSGSQGWRYLGAFDLVAAPHGVPGTRQLRFIPASEGGDITAAP